MSLMCMGVSCETTQKIDKNNGTSSVDVSNSVREQKEQTTEITEATDGISTNLGDIDAEANTILYEVASGEPSPDRIESSAENIKESVDEAEKEQVRIEEALEDLEVANARVAAAVGEIEDLEELIRDYEQSDREVRKEALKNLHNSVTLFFVIGFGMLVGGAFLTFWVNPKLGGIVLAIGVLTVGFAAASQYYLEEIATVGLVVLVVGFLATLGVVGWMLIKGRNNEKAITEIVELIEEMKDHLTQDERKEIFGRDGFASRLTSDMTKKIISEIKIKNGFKHLGTTSKRAV